MTKDEAVKIALDTVDGMNKLPFNHADKRYVTELIAVLAALGVLNLEERCPEKRAPLAEYREGLGWRIVPRCEPPPEHQNKRWHWIKADRDLCCAAWTIPGFAADKRHGTWSLFSLELSETEAGNQGWRYVGPCLPPE